MKKKARIGEKINDITETLSKQPERKSVKFSDTIDVNEFSIESSFVSKDQTKQIENYPHPERENSSGLSVPRLPTTIEINQQWTSLFLPDEKQAVIVADFDAIATHGIAAFCGFINTMLARRENTIFIKANNFKPEHAKSYDGTIDLNDAPPIKIEVINPRNKGEEFRDLMAAIFLVTSGVIVALDPESEHYDANYNSIVDKLSTNMLIPKERGEQILDSAFDIYDSITAAFPVPPYDIEDLKNAVEGELESRIEAFHKTDVVPQTATQLMGDHQSTQSDGQVGGSRQ